MWSFCIREFLASIRKIVILAFNLDTLALLCFLQLIHLTRTTANATPSVISWYCKPSLYTRSTWRFCISLLKDCVECISWCCDKLTWGNWASCNWKVVTTYNIQLLSILTSTLCCWLSSLASRPICVRVLLLIRTHYLLAYNPRFLVPGFFNIDSMRVFRHLIWWHV